MKIVSQKECTEQAKYYCDWHTDVECHNIVKTESEYGSEFDLQQTEVHLCDICFDKLKTILVKNFNAKTENIF